MLMRYHYGLGVGHVYSHHCSSLPESWDNSIVEQVESDIEDVIDGQSEDNEDDPQCPDQEFNSSQESLESGFDEMYGSDLELDYKN